MSTLGLPHYIHMYMYLLLFIEVAIMRCCCPHSCELESMHSIVMLRKERKMHERKETEKEATRAPVVVMPPTPLPGRQFVDFVMRTFNNAQHYLQLQ